MARRLSGALSQSADDVEPRPDAYTRLATRVVLEADDAPAPLSPWYRPSPGLVLALSLTMATLAGLALVVPRVGRPNQTVASLLVDGRTGSGPAATSSRPTSASSGPVSPPSATDTRTWPRTWPDRTAAVSAFLDLMGIEATSRPSWAVSQVGDDESKVQALVKGVGSLGPVSATLDLARVGAGTISEGWVVASASGQQVEIDSLAVDGRPMTDSQVVLAGSSLRAAGRAAGPAGSIRLELRSATTGVVLARQTAPAGDRPAAIPFAVLMPLAGSDQAWAVAWSGPDNGQSGGQSGGQFAARMVSYDGPPDPTTYLVTRLSAVDADAGLRLRRQPSIRAEVIESLAPGRAVTRRSGLAPVVVDGTVWWPVDTQAKSGWAAARYLAARPTSGADQIERTVHQVLEAAASPDRAGPWLPVSRPFRLPFFVGSTRVDLDPEQLSSPEGWKRADIPAGSSTRSLIEVLRVPTGDDTIDIHLEADRFPDPALEAMAEHTFGGLSAATADYTGTDQVHHRLHLYFEGSADGPRLVGIMAETGERS